MPEHLSTVPVRVPVTSAARKVAPNKELQRDVHAAPGLVVWARGSNSQLTVHLLRQDGTPEQITPTGGFGYMPKTDGLTITCYRQSGGIVLYEDLEETNRKSMRG